LVRPIIEKSNGDVKVEDKRERRAQDKTNTENTEERRGPQRRAYL